MKLLPLLPALSLTLCLASFTSAQAQTGAALLPEGIATWAVRGTQAAPFLYTAEGVLEVSDAGGWLRSPHEYRNFELSGQVRFPDSAANSGIFLRASAVENAATGWPQAAYEVQMHADPDNTDKALQLVNLNRPGVETGFTSYKRSRVLALYRGPLQWQDFTIRVNENTLTVELNGELVTEAEDLETSQGYLGFQSEAGTVTYRNLVIHEF